MVVVYIQKIFKNHIDTVSELVYNISTDTASE